MPTHFFISLLLILTLGATETSAKEPNETVQSLYHSLMNKPNLTMEQRLDFISQYFLSLPYENNPLGEGTPNDFDDNPRYRTDAFDCETYVDTVLALALATNAQGFKHCIDNIRYKDGNVSFIARNHFASLDWIPNNQHQGFIHDITKTIINQNKQPIALEAKALIDKPNWYKKLPITRIRQNSASSEEDQLKRLEQLKNIGIKSTQAEVATIPYLPLSSLFNNAKEPDDFIFRQIPHGAIISLVRPNWDLTQSIGTHLNISHLGFAFWVNDTLMFRQASSLKHEVVDVPLINYLRDTLESPTIKGINVQVVAPTPQPKGCSN